MYLSHFESFKVFEARGVTLYAEVMADLLTYATKPCSCGQHDDIAVELIPEVLISSINRLKPTPRETSMLCYAIGQASQRVDYLIMMMMHHQHTLNTRGKNDLVAALEADIKAGLDNARERDQEEGN